MLPEGRCSLRFTKLEKRSPPSRDQSSNLPSKSYQHRADGRCQHGHHDASDGFRGSEYGLAIDKESAAVERAGKCSSGSFLAPTAVPLATTSRISSCSNKEPCITAPHSDHLKSENYRALLVPRPRRLLLGQCPLLAQNGHASSSTECLLSGVKRT